MSQNAHKSLVGCRLSMADLEEKGHNGYIQKNDIKTELKEQGNDPRFVSF